MLIVVDVMMRHKFDVVVRIEIAFIKDEIGKMIKHVQTNNSMKFCLNLLNEFCIKEDIAKHCTSANEPQHVAELTSITLLEMTHKILSNASLAKRFPVDALSMAS